MAAMTGEGEVVVSDYDLAEARKRLMYREAADRQFAIETKADMIVRGEAMTKRHSDLLTLSSFGIAYPEIADLIRGLQRQVTAQQGLIKGLHGRIHALESQNARYGNDGR